MWRFNLSIFALFHLLAIFLFLLSFIRILSQLPFLTFFYLPDVVYFMYSTIRSLLYSHDCPDGSSSVYTLYTNIQKYAARIVGEQLQ